jgi:hypothetical protein
MKITISVDTEPSESPREIAKFLHEAAERLENAAPENAVGGKGQAPQPEGKMGFRRADPTPRQDIGDTEEERYPFPYVPED